MAEQEYTDSKLSSEECFNLLLELLDTTTPYKNESRIRDLLPADKWIDKCGNVWIRRPKPDGTESDTLFCCHMDTVGYSPEKTEPFYHNGFIYAMSNKSSCLGGDDRCGILCLLAMIHANIPGMYLFHVGEEKGTIGADFVSKHYKLDDYKRAIEFDRRGTTSIITVMMGSRRTCSETFAKALAKQLNDAGTRLEYKPDDTGLYTDVSEYSDEIAECTNISVGYNHEHSNDEKINADWLITQLIPALYKIDWESLPTERDPKADNTIHHGNWNSNSRWNRNNAGNNSNSGVICRTSSSSSSSSNKGSSTKKADDHAEFGDDYLNNYNSEHGLNSENEEITSIDGLSVFDEGDLFESCNFCGDRDDTIAEFFFEGRFWDLCSTCKEFLHLENAIEKRADEKVINNMSDFDKNEPYTDIQDADLIEDEEEKEIAKLATGGTSSETSDTNKSSTYSPIGFNEDSSENSSSGGFIG